ncbi:MAG: TIM44-like domain-containing protein [Anaerotardibacter sp.]
MKKKTIALMAACALVCMLIIPGIAVGDAGSFSGSSSYGGSSGGSSYSDSYSSSSTYYGSSSDSDGSSDLGDLAFAFIVVVIILVGAKIKSSIGGGKSGGGSGAQPAGATVTAQSDLKPMAEIAERDPEFNKKAVEEKVANIYVKMQNAWTAGDFEPMRPYFDNDMFAQFSRQLEQMKSKGYTNYVDNIAVLEVTARGWYESGEKENIVLKVRTRINDYIMDSEGNCVQGTPTRELFMEYEYVLSRPVGTKTKTQQSAVDSKHCPNCGAPLDEAASAKCEYCGSVITFDQHDWVISAIKGVSQQDA